MVPWLLFDHLQEIGNMPRIVRKRTINIATSVCARGRELELFKWNEAKRVKYKNVNRILYRLNLLELGVVCVYYNEYCSGLSIFFVLKAQTS